MRKLVVASTNQGKVREVIMMLEGLEFEVVSLAAYPDLPDVEETGKTFAENAEQKATAYADLTGELVLADDSGLEVDALDGAPGVYSSRYAPNDPARNNKVLGLMAGIPDDRRTARFRCAVSIAEPGQKPVTVEGRVEGIISHGMQGTNGFGYDPIFYLPELEMHMAELSSEEKNAISHRGKALKAARKILEEIQG